MELIDFIERISESRARRTEFGEGIYGGIVTGIVEENYSKDNPGCVRVKIPVRDEGENILKWAKVAFPYSGDAQGFYFLPEKNTRVLVVFEHGKIESPYVIACIPRDADQMLQKCADENNQHKSITTKTGNEIHLTDHKEGAEKSSVKIMTAGEQASLLMDNEKKKILLGDKESKSSLEMLYEEGEIELKAGKKCKMNIGEDISLLLNGESGTVTLNAKKFIINLESAVEIASKGTVKLSGQQVTIEGESMLKLSSGGMTTVGGSPVKLG